MAEAAALALVHGDDETNIRAALAARRLNPQLRLVIRLYNRKLGQHLEHLLDQAAALSAPGVDPEALDTTTTVLSDADTAAPALAATAVAGTSKVVQADGLLLRAVERTPPGRGEVADPGLCTLALLSATANDPAGAEGSDMGGAEGPLLLPDERTVAAATGRGTVVLEAVSPTVAAPNGRTTSRRMPLSSLFSRRLRWSLAGLVTSVLGLAVASWATTGDHPLHAGYLTLLDLFAIDDPAIGEPLARQLLQLLTGLAGLLLLPVLLAAVLEALGTFRTASALRRPPRGLSGHVVLLGLGKIGTRVLARLRELGIPVVCVEEDPEARGVALARRLRVPTVIGDVTQEGVLEAAKVHRAHALLALTSSDITNLEAALHARTVKPDLRVALRLFDDGFATAVYRTLRSAHPLALTRSRSVSTLAAPAFMRRHDGPPDPRRHPRRAQRPALRRPRRGGASAARGPDRRRLVPGRFPARDRARRDGAERAPPRPGRVPGRRRPRPPDRARVGPPPRVRAASGGPRGAGRHPPGPGGTPAARPPGPYPRGTLPAGTVSGVVTTSRLPNEPPGHV